MSITTRYADLCTIITQARRDYYDANASAMTDEQFDALMQELLALEAAHPELVSPQSPTQQVGAPASQDFAPSVHRQPMLSLDNVFTLDDLGAWMAKTVSPEAPDVTVEAKIDGVAINILYTTGSEDDLREARSSGRMRETVGQGDGGESDGESGGESGGESSGESDDADMDGAARPCLLVMAQAATRGDGKTGELVSRQVRTISDIPLFLCADAVGMPRSIEVRGEIYMTKAAFSDMNTQRQAALDAYEAKAARGDNMVGVPKPDDIAKNPRNVASGALRRKDVAQTAQFDLRVFIHSLGAVDPPDFFATQAGFVQWCQAVGLPTITPQWLTRDPEELARLVEDLTDKRDTLPFAIDGVVIKLNAIPAQQALGQTARAPRWGIAYKMPPLERETVLREITLTVGRTGKVTPNATIDPVTIEGITITHVSLHNELTILKKDVRLGDHIMVRRAADIIPEIVRPVLSKRLPDSQPWAMPACCPACGNPLVRELDDQGHHFCLNTDCPVKLPESLTYLAKRSVLDIEGLAVKRIEALCESGIVHSIVDIFSLHTPELTSRIDQLCAYWAQREEEPEGPVQLDLTTTQPVANPAANPGAASGAEPRMAPEDWPAHLPADLPAHLGLSPEHIAALPDESTLLGRKAVPLNTLALSLMARTTSVPKVAPDVSKKQGTDDIVGACIHRWAHLPRIQAALQEHANTIADLGFIPTDDGWITADMDHFGVTHEASEPQAGSLFDTAPVMRTVAKEERLVRTEVAQAWTSILELAIAPNDERLIRTGEGWAVLIELHSWRELLQQVALAFLQPFDRWIAALGIPLLGPAMAERLVETLASVDEIMAADLETLCAIDGFSEGKAQRIVDWFAQPHNQAIVQALLAKGMPSAMNEQTRAAKQTKKDLPFADYTFVITGNFEQGERPDLSQRLSTLGAKVTSSVSGKTTALIAGTESGSKKLMQANQRAIPILDSAALTLLLDGQLPAQLAEDRA